MPRRHQPSWPSANHLPAASPRPALEVLDNIFLSWATLSVVNNVGFIISMSSYAAALALLLAVKSRARAIPRGFQRIYNAGFVTTMTLYAAGIAWIFGHQSPWPSQAVVLAMSVVTALPCLVASIVVHRRAR